MAVNSSDTVLVAGLVTMANARADGEAWLTAHQLSASEAMLAGVEMTALVDPSGSQSGVLTMPAERKFALVTRALELVAGSVNDDDGFIGTDYSTREVRT